MSFSVSMEVFVENLSLVALSMLKKSELLLLASHYKLEITGNGRKANIQKPPSQF